jgi:hypothetical protein
MNESNASPDASTQRTVRQHFVPRRYLRQFKDEQGALWAYRKSDGMVLRTGEDGVAFENLFYDLEDGFLAEQGAEIWNERQQGEKAMQSFEREQAQVLDLLLGEGPHVGVVPDLRTRIAFMIAIQFLRTASFRRLIAQKAANFGTSLASDLIRRSFPGKERYAPTVTLTEGALRHQHMKVLLDIRMWRMIGDSLASHHWSFVTAPTSSHFLTSDNPVSLRPHLQHMGRDFAGFGSPGIEVVYPLSQKHLIWIRERTYHRLSPHNDGCLARVDVTCARRLNRIIASNCERFVFGCSSDFSETDEFLSSNKHLRNAPYAEWRLILGKDRKDKRRKTIKQDVEQYLDFPIIDLE